MQGRKVLGAIRAIMNTKRFEFEVCKIATQEHVSLNFSVWQQDVNLEEERKVEIKRSANG